MFSSSWFLAKNHFLQFLCVLKKLIVLLQERIKKVVAFILSLQSDVCWPFLIITTTAALSSWDDEFFRMAPSTSAVVYKGDRDLRKTIRTLEFYVEGGCIRFQVLITSAEVFIEVFLYDLHN